MTNGKGKKQRQSILVFRRMFTAALLGHNFFSPYESAAAAVPVSAVVVVVGSHMAER